VLSGGLVRKKPKKEQGDDVHDGGDVDAPTVIVLGAGLVRKKEKA
jgi:regulator of Ty1 transposition protein 109